MIAFLLMLLGVPVVVTAETMIMLVAPLLQLKIQKIKVWVAVVFARNLNRLFGYLVIY